MNDPGATAAPHAHPTRAPFADPAAREFFCAISTADEALSRVAARLPAARRSRLLRAASRDGTLRFDLIGAPRPGRDGYAQQWLAGSARAEGSDPSLRDGHFVLLEHGDSASSLRVQRDPLGVHPLFACQGEEAGAPVLVLSGSAAEALRATGRPARPDREAWRRFVATGTVAGHEATLFEGVRALSRDAVFQITAPALLLRAGPRVPAANVPALPSAPGERAEALWSALTNSVRRYAAPETGVALSGGVDSSAVLAALASLQDGPVDCYTFAFGGSSPLSDEVPWARAAALQAGARHHVLELDAARIPSLMRDVSAAQDFPFGSPVVLAQAALFEQAAAQGTRTLLGGHGPDLLCGGADSHLMLRAAQLLRQGRVGSAARFLRGARRYAATSAARLSLAALRLAATGRVPLEARIRGVPWLAPDWGGTGAVPQPLSLPAFAHPDPLQALIDAQLSHSAGGSSLLYERRNALWAGIEGAQPFLVASLRELCRQCPADDLVSPGGRTKHLLREALRGRVPQANLERPGRVGFAVPVIGWLRADRDWFTDRVAALASLPAWNGPAPDAAWRLLGAPKGAMATAFRLWRWLSLLEWSRRHDLRFD